VDVTSVSMNEEDNGHPKSYILQLEKMNINFGKIERNLPIATLIEIAIQRNEGLLILWTGAK